MLYHYISSASFDEGAFVTLDEIKNLVQSGESHELEFKRSTGVIKSALETACAFLNSDGGIILFGVTDDRRLVGQEVSDKTKREIGAELAKISPVPNIDIAYIPLPKENTYVIVFNVIAESDHRPYTCDGRAYLRNQSSTVQMPREYYQQLMLANSNGKHAWDHLVASNITLDDLDTDEILTTIKEGVLNGRIPEKYATHDPKIALQRLALLEDNKITNAALVLFGKNPEIKYPQCLLKLARFRGIDKAEFIDNKRVSGNIFKLMDAALAFIHTYIPISSTFPENSFKRIDTPLFPMKALREAIANALMHRDYSSESGSMSLAIFDNRIELWNFGAFPVGVTLSNLKNINCSIPRNRKIADVLYYHKIFESWGRGVQMIIDECKKAGHPEPSYSQNEVGTTLTLFSKQPIGQTQIFVKDVAANLTDRQNEVVNILLQHGDLSTDQIRSFMKNPPTGRWLRSELNILKELNIVQVKGNTGARKWFVS